MKILVVDDSKTARYLAVKTLNDLGYRNVTDVASGEDALIRMKTDHYDLVLLDWNMEGMSGLECLKQIRATPRTERTFVIMVTTVNEKKNVLQAVRVGISGYFFKPITPKLLKAKIKSLEAKLVEPGNVSVPSASRIQDAEEEHNGAEEEVNNAEFASAHATDYLAEKN